MNGFDAKRSFLFKKSEISKYRCFYFFVATERTFFLTLICLFVCFFSKMNKNSEIFNFCVELSSKSHLTDDIKLSLIEKMIKFILAQRSQLPLSFDVIKEELKKQEKSDTNRYKLKKFNLINDFILRFDEIFLNFNQCFNKAASNDVPEINKILVIIGGSIVTPKESYYLSFKSDLKKPASLSSSSVDECFIKKFFKSFVCFLQTIDFKEISCSQIYFLFEAERSEHIKWFLPKLNYSPPLKGKQIHVSIQRDGNSEQFCDKDEECQDLSFNNSNNDQADISGIEPLNETFERLDLNLKQSNDLIWYQSPIILKGVKSF